MPASFDVFLSHASADKPLVEELARRLAREDVKPWLDRWHLVPGTAWQPEIEAALADCAACAVIIGPGGVGPWHREEMQLAIRRRVEDRGRPFRVIPVLLPGVERPGRSKLPGTLSATTWVEFRDTLDEPEAFHRLLCGVRGIEPGMGAGGAPFEGKNPYRGLGLFDVEDAPLFFGREALTEWLLDALKRKPLGVENRFLAIIGASGSGKSSLARAGLMAALKAGKLEGSASWPRAICRPGSEPSFHLAKALTGLAPEPVAAVVFDRLQRLKDGERSLHAAAGLVLGEPPRAERLVVLVDQFEEVFTLCKGEAERRDFIANLLHAATVAGGRTIVVLTMRADFYPRCASHADLAAALSDHQVLVGPMTEDELRRAIDRPARLAGLEPEPGLVELLVDDLRGRPGALPLLQFALHQVWQRREDHRLTIRTYRDIGQVEGALQRKADAVYATFSDGQKELCRRVFLKLVQPGEGSEDTRRRASLRELVPDDPERAGAVQDIITRLTAPESCLLTTGRQQAASADGTLEVVHEALIRGWPQLRKWIEADRAGLRTQLRLTDGAKEWADAPADAKPGTLFTGARLAVASEWAASHRAEMGALEAAFLSASQEHERQRKADDAEKNRRLAEAETLRAEAERLRAEEAESRERDAEAATGRQKKLGRVLLIAAMTSLLLAVFAGYETWRANLATVTANETAEAEKQSAEDARKNEKRANEKERLATSRQLVALSASERDKNLDRSLLLAVEALRMRSTVEEWEGLFKALHERPGLKTFLRIPEGSVTRVAVSPDGKVIAAGYDAEGRGGGGVVLWDVATRRRLDGGHLPVKEGHVTGVAFRPDAKAIAAGYNAEGREGGGVMLWDVATRRRLEGEPFDVSEGRVTGVAFSGNGKTLVAGHEVPGKNGMIRWDLATRGRLPDVPLSVQEGSISALGFSPDGKALAVGFSETARMGGGVILLDLPDRHRSTKEPLRIPRGPVIGLSFNPDGRSLAAAYHQPDGGGVMLWDLAVGERPQAVHLPVGEGSICETAFSPDGKFLVAAYGHGVGGGVVRWDAETRLRVGRSPVTEGLVVSVAVGPDARTLVVAYIGGEGGAGIALWDLGSEKPPAWQILRLPNGEVTSLAFSPDNKTLAGSFDIIGRGGVALWNVTRGRAVEARLIEVEGLVTNVSFSPSGDKIIASYIGGALAWDAAKNTPLATPRPDEINKFVIRVAFSPDRKTVAALDDRGQILLEEVDLEAWVRRAREIANRNLTWDEWHQYFPDRKYRPTFPDLPIPSDVPKDGLGGR